VTGPTTVAGRLVLDDRVAAGRLTLDGDRIASVELDDEAGDDEAGAGAPYITPGFVDVHVHGWGGHDAMGDRAALDGMARALLRRGVTSFLPTAVTAPLDVLATFADQVRTWMPAAPADGAEPLGFNLEGPFLAPSRRGAHAEAHLRVPEGTPPATLDALVDGLRLLTLAPELAGATDLIGWLQAQGVVISIGHSAAGADQAWNAYAAGARSTTHLFNAMTGVDHRSPGVAVAALLDDDAYVELIADGIHVHPGIWPLITRLKPRDRLLLVSDALAVAGTPQGRGRIGDLDIEVRDGRATLAGTDTLAGSVIALDSAVRNAAAMGIPLTDAVAAASRNPLELLGVTDRGRLAEGQRADLVELDEDLQVRRVMRGGTWFGGA
jgi:N-acetylglucosamine-6-phosphate deacetylase